MREVVGRSLQPLVRIFVHAGIRLFEIAGSVCAGDGRGDGSWMARSEIGSPRCRAVRCSVAVAAARAGAGLHSRSALSVLFHPCLSSFCDPNVTGQSEPRFGGDSLQPIVRRLTLS